MEGIEGDFVKQVFIKGRRRTSNSFHETRGLGGR